MMKLTFEQVVEYLESGRDDPAFEQRIDDDPDGARLREEATLFLELLQDRAAEEPDEDSSIQEFAAEPVQAAFSLADAAEDFEEVPREINPKTVLYTARLASRAAGRVRDLGVLEIRPRGPGYELRHYPDMQAYQMRRGFDDLSSFMAASKEDISPASIADRMPDDEFMAFRSRRGRRPERQIRGANLEITLPDPAVLDRSGQIRLQLQDTRIGVPARGLELIFMPDKGPYERYVTNSKGVVELPVPGISGVLRLETPSPQMIRIELKNS